MEIQIYGANLLDQVFTITLKTGEVVTWNVTRLAAAAKLGAFGEPRVARTADLPPPDWSSWGAENRAKVDWIKRDYAVLNEPAIAIASENPDYALCCFADGQHRLTARQELGCRSFSGSSRSALSGDFRVDGLDRVDAALNKGKGGRDA